MRGLASEQSAWWHSYCITETMAGAGDISLTNAKSMVGLGPVSARAACNGMATANAIVRISIMRTNGRLRDMVPPLGSDSFRFYCLGAAHHFRHGFVRAPSQSEGRRPPRPNVYATAEDNPAHTKPCLK